MTHSLHIYRGKDFPFPAGVLVLHIHGMSSVQQPVDGKIKNQVQDLSNLLAGKFASPEIHYLQSNNEKGTRSLMFSSINVLSSSIKKNQKKSNLLFQQINIE